LIQIDRLGQQFLLRDFPVRCFWEKALFYFRYELLRAQNEPVPQILPEPVRFLGIAPSLFPISFMALLDIQKLR
jgi:hypothetical protein